MPEAQLVLGPILRRVTGRRATLWVQTSDPATVEVRAGTAGGVARTFTAYGRHYALVVVDGLAPGATTPYEVLLDGRPVWPDGGSRPPSVIRTRPEPDGAPTRLVFGSCRRAAQQAQRARRRYPPDALDAYASRLAANPDTPAPDALVLLGDQVYADEPSPTIRRWLRRRRRSSAPAEQVVTFEEYAELYLDSWTDPEIRWLLSTVPSVMIFDDHEIIDDWNTSESWRAEMRARPWWRRRISAGLASYWVYQHLGNLHPDALTADPVYRAVTAGGDATEVLAEFGERADDERSGYRWSYALDIGRTRLVVLDNRAGRELALGRRAMMPESEWDWLARTVREDGYDHLVVGSSLPWLLAPAIHHVEALDERLCDSPRRPVARVAERLRRGLDLEHWASFGRSFEALGALFGQLDGVSTVTVLSGDVHHSYAARALVDPPTYQLVCSPVHNELPWAMRPAVRLAWSGTAGRAARAVARLCGTPAPGLRWDLVTGPFYENAIGTLVHTNRSGYAAFEGTAVDGGLQPLAQLDLPGD
jgi:phosphodiesterase/alkaline phosphatase D-like protein